MRTSTKCLLATILAATPAFAGTSGTAGHGMLMTAFFGFAALIVAFQFVPAVMLFGAMLKGLFTVGREPTSVPKK